MLTCSSKTLLFLWQPYVVYMGSSSSKSDGDVQVSESAHLQLLSSIIPRLSSSSIMLYFFIIIIIDFTPSLLKLLFSFFIAIFYLQVLTFLFSAVKRVGEYL
jgi:heme O synthase-like polyprenyltransferase